MPHHLINVALLQMTACGNDQAANRVKGEEFCRRAGAMGADIALFPEMWNIGYSLPDPAASEERAQWQQQAIGHDDAFITHFQALARELQMAIALTYLEQWSGAPRNSVSLIDRTGAIVLTYAKVHTCEFDAECVLTPGEDFPIATLQTAGGPVQIGFMICYDREFPESARILMLQGAEIILTPNACILDVGRLGQFRARAFENMVGVAMTNYAAPQNNGHSIAVDAVAYSQPDGSPRDTLIIEAGEREGIYLAEFDLDSIRAYRQRETWGNAYRRPRCYGLLTDTSVQPPFVRPDATH
ncbi:MAG: carbon-nitrogen hydrolase family protein [Abitibacteriaceae bacterium]|nr:carbon-nitrogen hydrolase family protein [Abditibacteriaceae bacterium]MBV9863946.1 carbon-nitrogen hydrolase family protein [Abditibacteriaceae bacterium]